jgi:hypothetical protein
MSSRQVLHNTNFSKQIFLKSEDNSMYYLQSETLALLQYEERLAEAAAERLANSLPKEQRLSLIAWFQQLGGQSRPRLATRRPVNVEQAC